MVAAAVTLLSAPAYAIDRDSCANEVSAFIEAADYTFGEEYSREEQARLFSTGAINMEFIDSFQPAEAGDLAANAEAYRNSPESPETDPDIARVNRVERAAINCFFEKKLAELGGAPKSAGAGDDGSDSGVDAGQGGAGRRADADGYIYDDTDHGDCVSVEPRAPSGTGSAMAYGHYVLANSCPYSLKILMCIAFDRADGSPSPNFDLHVAGSKCPGIGWLGTTLGANATRDEREWFEYNQIKYEVKVCKDGWDFVGENGSYPPGILGEGYRCRQRRD